MKNKEKCFFIDDKIEKFTSIYCDFYPIVYNLIYKKIRDPDLTSDLCQDLFSRFFENMNTIINPRKWLYGSIIIIIKEYFRKNKDLNSKIDQFFDDVGLTFVNGFRDTCILIEEAIESEDVIKNDLDKIIFDLISINNFSYRETASHLGIKEHTVRYKYSIIVKRLKFFFKDRGIDKLEDLL